MTEEPNIVVTINTNKRQKVVPLYIFCVNHIIMTLFTDTIKTFGSYLLLMKRVLTKPERWSMFFRRTMHEIYQLGVNSIPIVMIISLFIGAALCIQMKTNVESPWMPKFVTGYATREVLLLEFSSTIMCLILAGKVGSNITSEIGAMKVTQQIDALDMMGVNSANFLILPKITGLVITIPFLVIFSIAAGIGGAFLIGILTGIMTAEELTLGLQHEFTVWFIWYSIIKSFFFAFIITSVASFYGYSVKGGSIEVGKASTNAVVSCSALILFADIVLTNIMMQ